MSEPTDTFHHQAWSMLRRGDGLNPVLLEENQIAEKLLGTSRDRTGLLRRLRTLVKIIKQHMLQHIHRRKKVLPVLRPICKPTDTFLPQGWSMLRRRDCTKPVLLEERSSLKQNVGKLVRTLDGLLVCLSLPPFTIQWFNAAVWLAIIVWSTSTMATSTGREVRITLIGLFAKKVMGQQQIQSSFRCARISVVLSNSHKSPVLII